MPKVIKRKVKQTKKKIKKPAKAAKKPAVKAVKKVMKKEKQAKAKPTEADQPKKQPKREAKAKKAVIKVAYDEDQLQKYKEFKQKLGKNSNAELKEMLKKNDQTCTGTKDELIEKIADGKVLGKIPRCPHCFGGRLRFDYKSGAYNCPGYRDDTEFHNCHKKYQFSEVTRDAWIE